MWQKERISEKSISEAPVNGRAYARKNGAWSEVEGEVREAPNDGNSYVRKNKSWAVAEGGITDAPNDGKSYIRKNKSWSELPPGFTPSAELEQKVDSIDAEVNSIYKKTTYEGGATILVALADIGCKGGERIHFESTSQNFTVYYGNINGNVGQYQVVWEDGSHGYIDYVSTASTHLRIYSLTSGNFITFTANKQTIGLSGIREGESISEDILYFNPENEYIPKMQQLKHNSNSLVLAHFSDIHGTQRVSLPRILRFADNYGDYIDDVIHTGDMVADFMNDGVFAFGEIEGAENVLNVIGNHDTANHSGGSYDWTANVGSPAYTKYFAPFIANWGVTHDGNTSHCYYYKDYASKGIRLIVLDCMGYDNTQDSWFSSILSATPSTYSVVVAAHCLGAEIEGFDCNWCSFYNNRKIASQSGMNADMSLMTSTLQTWIIGGGKFICWIIGHSHFTFVGKVKNTNQVVVLVDTAQYGSQTANPDSLHVEDTRSMDSFQIEAFNTTAKIITIVKVGCKNDKYGRIINSVCIDYQNGTIKAEA